MLLQAAKLLEENTQYLSDIDSRFGDGDHGITMGKIAKLIQERVPQWGEDSIKDFLDSLGMAVMEVKGGSAGPLYGTMIGGLGVNLDDDASQVDEAGLKAMFAGCLSEMEDITTAKVGDKTMMDALIPAVQAAQQTQGDCKAILEAAANRDIIHRGEENMIINNALEGADRVTIVTQGGSGHEPAISGFVGEGMVDISVVGDIFAAPGPQACVDAIKLADKGKGVLYIVLNHAGDMLTGSLTMKQCKKLGLNVVKVVTQEDVSNAPRENADDRRGLVGCIPTYKIAGAAAAEGKSLEEVAAIAQRFADNMATLAVAVRGATHPSTGAALADLGEDDMEIGMGQHGEGGGGRQPMKSADETAEIMVNALLKDIGIQSGEKVMLIINGSGATTLMEQLIIYRKCEQILKEKNIEIVANYVGELLTVQEQAGFQMFMARMDDELLRLWNAPCRTPYLTKK